MTTIQRIREEYQEPFRAVVIGFADQRTSKNLTAATLGIDRRHFSRLCTRFNLHGYFYQQSEQRSTHTPNGGRGENRLSKRMPMFYQGLVYWPSEPTNAMLYERYNRNERQKMIIIAKKLLTL